MVIDKKIGMEIEDRKDFNELIWEADDAGKGKREDFGGKHFVSPARVLNSGRARV